MFPPPSETVDAAVAPRVLRLLLAYDGTDFFGWQVQPGRVTVQGTLQDCIASITGERTLPQGSGRTDTGVHAEGQVVSLPLSTAIPADRLLRALNRRLPGSIRVLAAHEAAADFHARAGVLDKTYEYRIYPRRVPGSSVEAVCPPQLARYVWDCRWPLQLDALNQAASALLGTHDFTSFTAADPDRTARDSGSIEPRSYVRTIFASRWTMENGLLCYRVTGSGFLHHMVRNIVGTCVDAGAGRTSAAGVGTILAARDRRHAGATAPPQGLHLLRVRYAADEVSDAPCGAHAALEECVPA